MDRKLIGLLSVFFLAFALFVSVIFFHSNLGKGIRATESENASSTNSIILVYPLELNSNDGSYATISVFVRDADSKALPNKIIDVSTSIGTVTPARITTDPNGKAAVNFTCTSPGTAQIHAIINSTVNINQTVTIKCN